MQNNLKFSKKEKKILMLLVLLSVNKLVCVSITQLRMFCRLSFTYSFFHSELFLLTFCHVIVIFKIVIIQLYDFHFGKIAFIVSCFAIVVFKKLPYQDS